jgi:hypothetical protein
MIENQKSELRTAYDKGYNQCVKDFNLILEARKKEEEGYNRGVNDLWESVCKFMDADITSDKEIWGCTSWEKFAQLSPSEVIERLKEYNKKQEHIIRCCKNCKHSENGMVGNSKRCVVCYYNEVSKGNTLFEPMETDNSKIEVGDEVRDDMFDKVGVVIRIADNHAYVLKKDGIGTWTLDAVVKTGTHFEEVSDMMKHLENTDA